MATSFAEALKGIDTTQLTENTAPEMTEKEWEAQKEIEMLERYLKMCERNASEKERFYFAQEYGFVSEKHFKLWMATIDEYHNHLEELELYEGKALEVEKENVKQLESQARNIRNKSYYCMMMRKMKQKDYSPYGENLLKYKGLFAEETRTIDIEAQVASNFQYVMSYK